jgi:hypothetical protein
MIRPVLPKLLAVVAILAIAPPALSAATIPYIDPTGDTFFPGPVHDITTFQTTASATEIVLTVDFAGPILPASAFDPFLSLTGFIDIDTDQNAATGGVNSVGVPGSNQSFFGLGPSGLGIEYYIDLGLELFGEVPVVDATTNLDAGVVPIVFDTSSFTLTVPTDLLGFDDGNVNYGLIAGDIFGPTDEATNPGLPVAYSQVGTASPNPIPEPGTALIWGTLAAVAIVGYRTSGRSTKSARSTILPW